MVFAMLMEAAQTPDPTRFKESDLFRRCVEAGIVPAAQADLDQLNQVAAADSAEVLPNAEPGRYLDLQRRLGGMWCPACAWVIQAALARMPGVVEAACDFATDRLRCRFDPVKVAPEEIERAISRLGYGVTDDAAAEGKTRREFVRLVICAILSVNVMMISWAVYAGFFTELTPHDLSLLNWPIMLMATAVLVYGGATAARKAWFGLRAGAPGMETLIVMGAGSAFLYSVYSLLRGSPHIYFDTAAMLITLLLLGKQLEAHAKARVRRELEAFLSLRPRKVRMITPGWPTGRFTALEQLSVGERFIVHAEEIVPADGRVEDGRGWVDASAVSGEPRPLAAGPGDVLISGSRVREGSLTVRAERIGEASMLGRMIGAISESLSRKPKLETGTDRLLIYFIPLLIGLAAIAGGAGYGMGLTLDQALIRAVTVMVVACPCAIGIAIPLARVAGIAGAGRSGQLVRDYDAFERAGRIDTVVLDKTGTLTHGRWRLEKIAVTQTLSEAEALALAWGLEKAVDHTIARAIGAAAKEKGITAAEVEDITVGAEGVGGRWRGRAVKLGRRAFAVPDDDEGVEPTAEEDHPLSLIYLSIEEKICAALGFGDRLRPGTADFIDQLKARGCELHLVSGDGAAVTAATARLLGIEKFRGGLLPQQKAEYIDDLKTAGRKVAMVGDGLNDAPALAQADLSVAVHSGAPLTPGAADVTLVRGDPAQLLDFFDWSGRVTRKVRQNLWCASIYNLLTIPAAMAGLFNPVAAVCLMLLSSLTVIGNTLLLVQRHDQK
jgi:heavy metal translocating P-type ATPase